MPITFNQIPDNIRVPGVYVEQDNTRALRGLPQFNGKVYIIGQRLSSGAVAQKIPTLVNSATQGKQYFGRGSFLANMIEVFKANNRFVETYAIALDDISGGTAATGTITFTGPATANGTISLYVAGKRVQVAVTAADTATNIATNTAAAINANGDLPVTATSALGVVTVTCRHKGTLGNQIDLRVNYRGLPSYEATPAGVTVTIVAMSGGATDPAIQDAIDVFPDETINFIVTPYTDATNLNALEVELENRWGPFVMQEGVALAARAATLGNLSSFGNGRNSEFISVMGTYDSPTPSWEWASAYGAQVAASASVDPARPFQTLELYGILPPPTQSRFSLSERNTLLYDGIATFRVADNGDVQIERAITTYQTNALNAPDPSYLDLETILTLAYLRQSARDRIRTKFPRHKLADDGTRFGPGQAIVTPKIIKAELIALFVQWEEVGLVENLRQFKQELIVERNISDNNRVDVLMPPDLINQLRITALQLQFLL